jgi:Domain of unknown function (DUF4129)
VRSRPRPRLLVATTLGLVMFAGSMAHATEPAAPPNAHDQDAIDRTARAAYDEGKYSFCKTPTRPLGARQQELCELATEIEGCEGFAAACHTGEVPKDSSWLQRLGEWLAPIAKALLYLLVLAIVAVVAIPVVRAILKRRRERRLGEPLKETPNRAQLVEVAPVHIEEVSDAEQALRLADEHRARGELAHALGLYLAASLAALDRRGAIRIGKHRTNGEYVRGCAEDSSRPQLREIVRVVDQVEFGGTTPTDEGLARVADRARAIVRATSATLTVLALALFASGCSAPQRSADPAGDDLPVEVLRRNGFKVSALGTSLATMPIPEQGGEPMPVVIVDVEKVPLEDEAQAHMMRWVEAGGVLVLFGHVNGWPSELRPREVQADTRDLVVRTEDPNAGDEDDDEDDDSNPTGVPIEIKGARTARRDAFAWKDAESTASASGTTGSGTSASRIEPVAFLGKEIYAARRRIGAGLVLGVANDDLFTNVGVMPAHNAAALVTLVRSASHDLGRRLVFDPAGLNPAALGDLRVARTEDGIPPPANPFAALMAAGLGKGAWHALAAAILLFLAYGIRQARPRPVERKERRAFAEHIEATGAFYARTHAHVHALGAYGRFLELKLREVLPRGADPVQFLASRSGADPQRIAGLYERALSAKAGDEPRGDELAVIEELRRMLDRALGPPG